MKKLLLLLTYLSLGAEEMSPERANKIVDAIYIIEGGTKAKVPYGILSVPVRDKAHARKLCFQTVVNNHKRWLKAGKPGEYFDFLADRYCPPSVDPKGNKNWKSNIRKVLHEK